MTPNPKGFLGGATVGYNLQTGIWVGLEGDFDVSTMKGSVDYPGGVSCETKNSWLATARARIGYAGWSNWLPYITAGAAGGDIKATDVVGSATKTKIGWTAGLGVEYAFMSNWSAKLEYLYADLGKFDCGSSCTGVVGPPTTSASKPTSCARASTTASDYRAALSAQRRKAPDGSPGFSVGRGSLHCRPLRQFCVRSPRRVANANAPYRAWCLTQSARRMTYQGLSYGLSHDPAPLLRPVCLSLHQSLRTRPICLGRITRRHPISRRN